MRSGVQAIERLRHIPGGAQVLAVLERHDGALLVGGAVRDLLLGSDPQEIDIVAADDVEQLADRLGTVVAVHRRFGTYTVKVGALSCDIARRRREYYSHPGALPQVAWGTVEQDLRRRDFTINALTLSAAGILGGAPGALSDLLAGRLRVFHRDSFRDDPTRLWRLVRYAVRLGFTPTPETDLLAVAAIEAGLKETISSARATAELRSLLSEPDPGAALHAATQLGLVDRLLLDPAQIAAALSVLPASGDRALTLLGVCLPDIDWLKRWDLTAREQTILTACASIAALPASPPAPPTAVAAIAARAPVEAVAVAAARGSLLAARKWFNGWSRVRPQIGGDDLIAAGIEPGPDLGRRLQLLHAALLDGRLAPGAAAELEFALAVRTE